MLFEQFCFFHMLGERQWNGFEKGRHAHGLACSSFLIEFKLSLLENVFKMIQFYSASKKINN